MGNEFLDELSIYGVSYRELIRELLQKGVLQKLASSGIVNPRVWATEPQVRDNYDTAMNDFIFIVSAVVNGTSRKITKDNKKTR